MSHTYNGNAANVAGLTQVAVTQPDDGDPDNAAAQNVPSSKLSDWLQAIACSAYTFFKGITFAPTTSNTTAVTATGSGNGNGGSFTAGATGAQGVEGISSAASSQGVYGVSGGASGQGVQGIATAAGGVGVNGIGTNAAARGGQFQGGANVAAVNLIPQAPPSSFLNGDIWVDTTDNAFEAKINGSTLKAYPQTTPVTVSAFSNSWAGPSANGKNPRYWKDINGVVHLDGTINGASAVGIVAFTLPAGFRPVASGGGDGKSYFPGYRIGTSSFANTEIIIDPSTGNVSCAAFGNNWDVSLDGISFPTF